MKQNLPTKDQIIFTMPPNMKLAACLLNGIKIQNRLRHLDVEHIGHEGSWDGIRTNAQQRVTSLSDDQRSINRYVKRKQRFELARRNVDRGLIGYGRCHHDADDPDQLTRKTS